MEAACRAWELCMNRDPTVIGRIDVVAETFAGVINSFVDPISWKTMVRPSFPSVQMLTHAPGFHFGYIIILDDPYEFCIIQFTFTTSPTRSACCASTLPSSWSTIPPWTGVSIPQSRDAAMAASQCPGHGSGPGADWRTSGRMGR
jgi:hypothetical protein